MNDWSKLSKQAEAYKKLYPEGSRLLLINMDDPYAPVPAGTRGTVQFVDDIGDIHVSWDNNRSLAIVPDVDSFRPLTPAELALEKNEEKTSGSLSDLLNSVQKQYDEKLDNARAKSHKDVLNER